MSEIFTHEAKNIVRGQRSGEEEWNQLVQRGRGEGEGTSSVTPDVTRNTVVTEHKPAKKQV